jgi:hypothetical protein
LLLLTVAASAQTVVQDGFESGAFAAGWSLTSGVTTPATGGANGSARNAQLAAYSATTGRELGARFDSVAPDGAKDFSVDFFFRAQNTTQRRLNLHVSTSTAAVGSGAPAINLKYDATDGWAAYNGSWQKLPALGSVSAAQWYRVRITGADWGLPAARYAIAVSAAGGTNFIASVTNLTFYQGGTPTALAARYFVFTSVYGNGPGFDVDEITAQVTGTPAVETNAIRNLSGTYPHLAVFSSGGRDRPGRGRVPWADRLVVRHLSAAPSPTRQCGQALDGRFQPHADRAAGERGRHARQPLHPPRDAAAQPRPVPGGHQRRTCASSRPRSCPDG